MSSSRKLWVVFFAEYLVIAQGLLFFAFIMQVVNPQERIGVLFSGTILLLLSLLVTKIIKRIVRKERPPKKVELFTPLDRYAFPSAHSTALFSTTAFILSLTLVGGILAFLVSLVIVIARVQSRVHDFSDILGGFVVGVSVTYYCMPFVATFVYTYLMPVLLR